jgi:hypothetical protein
MLEQKCEKVAGLLSTGILAAASTVIPHPLNFPFEATSSGRVRGELLEKIR